MNEEKWILKDNNTPCSLESNVGVGEGGLEN